MLTKYKVILKSMVKYSLLRPTSKINKLSKINDICCKQYVTNNNRSDRNDKFRDSNSSILNQNSELSLISNKLKSNLVTRFDNIMFNKVKMKLIDNLNISEIFKSFKEIAKNNRNDIKNELDLNLLSLYDSLDGMLIFNLLILLETNKNNDEVLLKIMLQSLSEYKEKIINKEIPPLLGKSRKDAVFEDKKEKLFNNLLNKFKSNNSNDDKSDIDLNSLGKEERELYNTLYANKNTMKVPLINSGSIALNKFKEYYSIPNDSKIQKEIVNNNKSVLHSNLNIQLAGDNQKPFEQETVFHPHLDLHREKSYLDFDKHNFKKITLEQKAQPPNLVFNLDVCVKNPGIYSMEAIKELNDIKDIEFLEKLPKAEEIEFDNFEKYMAPFEDSNLKKMVKKMGYKYASSTSGISALLSHFFYKLTNFKSPHFYNLSEAYESEPLKFMMYQRKPTQIELKREDGIYTISKSKVFEALNEIVLLKMGKKI